MTVLRKGAEIVRWTESEIKRLNQKTTKSMTNYVALYPKSDADRLYVGRGRRTRFD